MINYLLGDLPEQERGAIEEQYFNDPEVFEKLSRVESQLIDDYVRGRLSAEERQKFERVYLSNADRRQRVRFAEALITKADQVKTGDADRSNGFSWWRNLLAPFETNRLTVGLAGAALLILLTASIWLFVEYNRLRQELNQTRAGEIAFEQRERALKQELAQEQDKSNRLSNELSQAQNAQPGQTSSPSPTTGRSFVSLIISLSSTRDPNAGGPTKLNIPPATHDVRLQIRLNENIYQRYVVRVQTAEGQEVFTQRDLSARGPKGSANLNLTVPASRVETGDYLLIVQGANRQGELEDLSKSFIHVEKN